MTCTLRLLQALDPHANEYMERLKDEAVLLALAQKVWDSFHPRTVPALQFLLWVGQSFPAVPLHAAMQVSDYLVGQNELDKLAGVALRRLHHFYYKTGVHFDLYP